MVPLYRQNLGTLRTLLLVALGQGEIGERIKQAREDAGLTQPQLANLIGLRHPQSISNYERGIGEVPPQRLRQISEVTKQPLSFFVAEPPTQNGEPLRAETELTLLRSAIADLAQVVATIAAGQKTMASELRELRRESAASQRQALEQP